VIVHESYYILYSIKLYSINIYIYIYSRTEKLLHALTDKCYRDSIIILYFYTKIL